MPATNTMIVHEGGPWQMRRGGSHYEVLQITPAGSRECLARIAFVGRGPDSDG